MTSIGEAALSVSIRPFYKYSVSLIKNIPVMKKDILALDQERGGRT